MDQINHKHDWKILIGVQHNNQSGDNDSAIFKCKGCGLKLHASDAIQLQLLRFTTGWSKWLSIIAIIISAVALAISILPLFPKQ